MLLANGKWQYDMIPKFLPCGAQVNQAWRPGLPVECCRTKCPDKNIEECHTRHKRMNRRPEFEPPKEDKQA